MARPVLAGERAPAAPPPDGATNTQGETMNFTGRADWVAFVACIALVVLCVVYQVAAL